MSLFASHRVSRALTHLRSLRNRLLLRARRPGTVGEVRPGHQMPFWQAPCQLSLKYSIAHPVKL